MHRQYNTIQYNTIENTIIVTSSQYIKCGLNNQSQLYNIMIGV